MPLPPSGATFTFGRTAGIVAGACSRYPALALVYSESLYRDGRLVLHGTVVRSPMFPPSHLTRSTVRQLIQRAKSDGFFHIDRYMRDISCPAMSTFYIRVQAGGMSHTVEVYGYDDSRHPALNDLLQQLGTATSTLVQ